MAWRFGVEVRSGGRERETRRHFAEPPSFYPTPPAKSSAAAAASGATPAARRAFSRDVAPETTATAPLGTPRTSASHSQSVALALPSTGGAASLTLSASPWTPATSVREARGTAWMRTRHPPVAAETHGGRRLAAPDAAEPVGAAAPEVADEFRDFRPMTRSAARRLRSPVPELPALDREHPVG